MKRLSLVLILAACAPATQDELARGAARAAITPVLEQRLPGVPVQGAVDCVINGASAQEILVLAADSVTGPTASTAEITTRILSRPQVQTCIAQEYAGLVLSGL